MEWRRASGQATLELVTDLPTPFRCVANAPFGSVAGTSVRRVPRFGARTGAW
jgi:hypothetical protein